MRITNRRRHTSPPMRLSIRRAGFKPALLIFTYDDEIINGAGGRNRTDMELPPEDFESSASTSFTTPALIITVLYLNFSSLSIIKIRE